MRNDMVEVAYGKNVCPKESKRTVKAFLEARNSFNPRRSIRRNLLSYAEQEGFRGRLEKAVDKLDDFIRANKKVGQFCLYLKAGQVAKLCGVPDLE